MNIKEHIEAGHYPKDEKGRALVPHGEGDTVIIYATDGPQHAPIVGLWHTGVLTWPANTCRLLPPLPRKVVVKGWAEVVGRTINTFHFHKRFAEAAAEKTNEWSKNFNGGVYRVVELTGEYEEEWK